MTELKMLDRVEATRRVTRDAPASTIATIVGIWQDGLAYEIEVSYLEETITVLPDEIRKIE